MRCLFFVRDLEAKVNKVFSDTFKSTGKTYEEMVGVLNSTTNPGINHFTAHNGTPERYQATDFVMLCIGEVMTKMSHLKLLTRTWSWPPPVPESKLYRVTDTEFLRTDSFRELADIDRYITQVCMEIQLVEILERDSCADKDTLRICLNPLQMALRSVWESGIMTVESIFAAAILLDFRDTVSPPEITPPKTRRATVMDVKTRIYRDRSFYPFEKRPSQ